ncbi:MAG: TlpA disulfide reductase family protein [Deltaproteobacteria bacterium]|nr:TlpA disulfide reductase family protein [Deltaproteobacteria bacterium]
MPKSAPRVAKIRARAKESAELSQATAASPAGSSWLRAGQLFFVLGALAAVIHFGAAVRDGETRRSSASLLRMLAPDYQGENRTAPDFSLPDKDGRTHTLSSLRGSVVVLHFWSRTCPPCIEELQRSIPAFDELVAGRSDVKLLLVTTDPDWASVASLVPEGLRSSILFDPNGRIVTQRYGTRQFPETWVIDPRGVIRARFDHTIEWDSAVFFDFLQSVR